MPRRPLLTVQFSPQFISKIFAHLKNVQAAGPQAGLLFGTAEKSAIIVQSFSSLQVEATPSHAELEKAFDAWVAQPGSNAEVAWLDLIGWFCIRSKKGEGGMRGSEIDFHNGHFVEPTNLALVLHPAHGEELTGELYTSCANVPLSHRDHCRGWLRLDLRNEITKPIKVEVRQRINDESYLRPYEASQNTGSSQPWKNFLQALMWPKWRRPRERRDDRNTVD